MWMFYREGLRRYKRSKASLAFPHVHLFPKISVLYLFIYLYIYLLTYVRMYAFALSGSINLLNPLPQLNFHLFWSQQESLENKQIRIHLSPSASQRAVLYCSGSQMGSGPLGGEMLYWLLSSLLCILAQHCLTT